MAKQFKRKMVAGREVFTHAARKAALVPRLPSWLRRDWLWGLLLILAVILVYQPVWFAGFVWDDDSAVTKNPCIVGPFGLKEIWTTRAGQFFPLVLTTFWVEHALWGLAPLPYHLVNVLQQAICAVLLWRVLRSLQVPGAWLGAALWALHPVQVESVAWISEMKNTQSCVFYLLTILFFVRWLKARDLDGRTGAGWDYGLTLLFAALAMASKSSTVVLPVVLCLCAWWMEGKWHWRNLVRVFPVFFMSVVATALSMWSYIAGKPAIGDPQWARSWPQRVAASGDVIWFYLGKLVWPHPLITIYARWKIDADQWFSYLPLLGVIVVLFILWLKRETWLRPAFFAFAYFLVVLSPFLGLIDQAFWRLSFVEDHLQYLACMGPLALAGAGMVKLVNFIIQNKPWLQSTLGAGLLLILGGMSWQRAWAYESEETLWTDALAKNPDCWIGYNNLGAAFIQEGRLDDAIVQYHKALTINPNYDDASFGLGVALSQMGRMDAAMVQYHKALKINPNSVEAYINLGTALQQKGRLDEAIAQDQNALKINPNSTEAHNNLGDFLLQKGRLDEAIIQFQKALEINPNIIEAHDNLGAILLKKGRVDEAMTEFQKALEINPNNAEALINLGVAFFQKGHADEAIIQLQKAVRLNPNDVTAQKNLATMQAMARQVPGSK